MTNMQNTPELYINVDNRILDLEPDTTITMDDGKTEPITIDGTAKAVYITLQSFTEKNKISHSELSKCLGASITTVKKYISILEKARLIEVKRVSGEPNEYKLNRLEESRINPTYVTIR